jgi:hypothetical protein
VLLARLSCARGAASETPSAGRAPAIWRISRNHIASTTSQQSNLLLIDLNGKVTGAERDEIFDRAGKRDGCCRLPRIAWHTRDAPKAYREATGRRRKHAARIQDAARAYAQDGNGLAWANEPPTRLRLGERHGCNDHRQAEQAERDGMAHSTPCKPEGCGCSDLEQAAKLCIK